jgi:hypothetical protein
MPRRLFSFVASVVVSFGGLVVAAPPAHAASALLFGRIYYNSPGTDTRTNTSLNAEWAIVKNVGTTTRCLTNWTVRDAAGHTYKFGSFCLGAGKYVYLHTGRGTNTASHRYWGSGNYIWNNTGDRAYLRNSVGTLMDSCSWGSSGSYTYC